jgi:hypothetical protein
VIVPSPSQVINAETKGMEDSGPACLWLIREYIEFIAS